MNQDADELERGLALTKAQEAFVVAYVVSHRALEAYRLAFDVPEAVCDAVVWHEASAVLGNHDVILRIIELQEEVPSADIDGMGEVVPPGIDGVSDADILALTRELEKARIKAMDDEKGANTAVSATMGKAKLLGLISERRVPASKTETPELTVAIVDFAKMSHDPDTSSQ